MDWNPHPLDAHSVPVHRRGKGKPLVLMHCLGQSHRFWDVLEPLTDTHELIAYSYPGHGDAPLATRAACDKHRIVSPRQGRQLGRGVELAHAASNGAAVARLAVADVADRLGHQRQARSDQRRELQFALARHRADFKHIAVLANMRQRIDAIQIDQVVWQHQPHVEHGHQRLATGEQLGVVRAGKQGNGLGDGCRIVISEKRRFHAPSGPTWQDKMCIICEN